MLSLLDWSEAVEVSRLDNNSLCDCAVIEADEGNCGAAYVNPLQKLEHGLEGRTGEAQEPAVAAGVGWWKGATGGVLKAHCYEYVAFCKPLVGHSIEVQHACLAI